MISWKWFARRFILVFVVYLLVAVNLGVCYAASLSTKSKYAPSEAIIVNYFGFPGTASDWITIVPAGTPDNQYKEWHYTNGQPNGTMSFQVSNLVLTKFAAISIGAELNHIPYRRGTDSSLISPATATNLTGRRDKGQVHCL